MNVVVMYSSKGDGSWTSGTYAVMPGVLSVSIGRNFGESIPSCNVQVIANSNIKVGNEIRIYAKNGSDPNITAGIYTDLYFRGTIEKISVEAKTMTLTCDDWLSRTKKVVSNQLFSGTKNITTILPLLVAEAKDAADVGLSCNIWALSNLPITQLTDFDCRGSSIFEKLQSICEMIDAWFVYNPRNLSVEFHNKDNPNLSAMTLSTYGYDNPNIINVPKWNSDCSNIINDGNVKGGNFSIVAVVEGAYWYYTSEGMHRYRFTGRAGVITKIERKPAGYTEWTTNTELLQAGVLVTPYGTGNGVTFYIDALDDYGGAWRVTFTEAYNEVNKYASDSASKTTYGKRQSLLDGSSFRSLDSLQNYVTQMIGYWKDKVLSVELAIGESGVGDFRDLVGRSVNINDGINGVNFVYGTGSGGIPGWKGIIQTATFSYPSYGTQITISDHAIKNPSSISAISKMLNNTINTMNDSGLNDNVKTDGSSPMSGNLNMNGNEIINFTVETTTNLR